MAPDEERYQRLDEVCSMTTDNLRPYVPYPEPRADVLAYMGADTEGDSLQPYATAAEDYLARGWSPLPIDPSDKAAKVPPGFTGYEGADASPEDVARWMQSRGADNIAVRVAPGIAGIDVDHYDDKHGGDDIRELETRYGKLPATWTSTARGADQPSRIHWFRVPTDTRLSDPTDDIEVIQRHHRYALVWPSVHPKTGATYQWYTPGGRVTDHVPHVNQLPELPPAWVEGLKAADRVVYSAEQTAEIRGQWNEPEGEPCAGMQTTLDHWRRQLEEGGDRNGSMVRGQRAICGDAMKGHRGADTALRALHETFMGVTEGNRARQGAWDRGMRNAIPEMDLMRQMERRDKCDCDDIQPITPADVIPALPIFEPIPVIPYEGRSADGDLAIRFANDAADRLVLTSELGWLWYDGKRWREDTRGVAAKQYRRSLKARLQDIAKMDDAEARKKMFVDTNRLDRHNGLEATIAYAGKSDLMTPLEDFDADPFLLNTSTGVLDLRTGAVQPHHPRLRMLKMTRAGYEHGITPLRPTWDRFIAEVLPDEEVRGFVQRLLGYALVGSVTEHILPVFYGSGGGGKSTLIEAVSWALGDYANPCSADLLLGATSAGGTEGVDLFGTRFAPASETDEGKRLAAGTVKKLTGGDTMKARRLYRDSITWQPTHTIVLVTNSLPKADGTDSALFQRVRVVPFTQRFRGTANEDRSLGTRLKMEADGILAWMVEGYREYERRGLDEPEAVRFATDDYQQDSDELAEFLDARFDVTHSGKDWVLTTAVWDEWRDYCRTNRVAAGSRSDLKRKLEERGLPEERVRVDGSQPRAFIGLSKRTPSAPF